MLRIGLTGGIGSGKSTVGKLLQSQGCYLIDADALSHALTAPDGLAMPMIQERFGADMLDDRGALNRSAMRAAIVRDPSTKRTLEDILHPMIGHEVERLMLQAQRAAIQAVVVDIPLLAESGWRWRSRLDEVWVVDCRKETQVTRVQTRNEWPLAQIEAVIAAQACRLLRLKCADTVIYNDDVSLEQLQDLVQLAWQMRKNRP